MQAIQHNKHQKDCFQFTIPVEYVRAINIKTGMDFSYKINPDGSLLITPKKQE